MPTPRRRRLTRELFETRSHSWHAVGLGEELERRAPRRARAGLLLAAIVIAATLFVYERRQELLPGYGPWVRAATVAILVIVGSAAAHWLVRTISPRLFRRLDPATAGTIGFLIRLVSMAVVVIVALRIAGVQASTLAVGGAFTAVVLGLAAQQSLGSIFAGIVMQTTRPFRVGERVRLVGGMLAGSIEGTVSSLGLFYTTLAQGADRLLVPNSVLIDLVVVPLREPEKIDLRARFSADASPRQVEERLLSAVKVPTRHPPHVALEEVDEDGIVMRISATPLRPGDGSQLAEEVLAALRRTPAAAAGEADWTKG
ncbi:MAG TPA: mechanosensitive ion channel family protein [Solirubrobacterales bacterium]|nr:mechanosensitive ion channel family protein [Solirubrobacterales bacterium]